MKYLSVCSGIEAATTAWHALGWEPIAFSEIEKFPSEVLAHHYPDVPNLGDMTRYKEWPDYAISLLVGGTPCQSFSVAGLRRGLTDPRGNLMLTFGAIAKRYRPVWLVWENVPGVLSSNGGKDFGTFLGMLAELGYGFAYRVLDAQYFGVPQRRRRVFVVGHLGDWRRAAAVLFERESVSGNPAPSRKKEERVAPTVTSGPPFSRTGNERVECEAMVVEPIWRAGDQANAEHYVNLAGTLNCNKGQQGGIITCNHEAPIVAFTARDNGRDAALNISPTLRSLANTGGKHQAGSHGVAVCFDARQHPVHAEELSMPLGSKDTGHAVCFGGDIVRTLSARYDSSPCVDRGMDVIAHQLKVRRLLPEECEKLQGFLPGYTNIPWRGKPESPDGPRYKALGNSMAVPVMRWIGERIQLIDANLQPSLEHLEPT